MTQCGPHTACIDIFMTLGYRLVLVGVSVGVAASASTTGIQKQLPTGCVISQNAILEWPAAPLSRHNGQHATVTNNQACVRFSKGIPMRVGMPCSDMSPVFPNQSRFSVMATQVAPAPERFQREKLSDSSHLERKMVFQFSTIFRPELHPLIAKRKPRMPLVFWSTCSF